MANIGFSEILLIAVLALVVLGPEKLPELGQKLGGFWRQFQDAKRQVHHSLTQNTNSPADSVANRDTKTQTGSGARDEPS